MMRTTEHTQQLTERDSAISASACLFGGYLPSIGVAARNPKWRPAS